MVNLPGHFVGAKSSSHGKIVHSTGTKPCSAMKAARIKLPDSQDGINFCLESCPYPWCELETQRGKTTAKRSAKVKKATDLRKIGYSIQKIAEAKNVSIRTVHRWLK